VVFGAGLPTIFAFGVRFLAPTTRVLDRGTQEIALTQRSPLALVAGIVCMTVVVVGVVLGILFIMRNFLAHDLGIDIF
jgi:hypothetical protein